MHIKEWRGLQEWCARPPGRSSPNSARFGMDRIDGILPTPESHHTEMKPRGD